MADSTIYTGDLIRYAAVIANEGEENPLKWASDQKIFAHCQAANMDIARELRGKEITIFTKQSEVIRIPAAATSLTSTAQTATSFVGSGLDDATFTGTYTGTASVSFTVAVTATGTFKWKKNDGNYTTGVAMTGSAQALSDGISVTFAATTGHTIGDYWVYMSYLYPINLIRPQIIHERTATTPTVEADEYNQMTMSTGFIPDQTDGTNRQLWDWRDQTIVFDSATVIQDLQIMYEFDVPILRRPYQQLLIPEGYTAVAHRAASYYLAAAGKPDRAKFCMDTSLASVQRVVENEVAIRKANGTVFGTAIPNP